MATVEKLHKDIEKGIFQRLYVFTGELGEIMPLIRRIDSESVRLDTVEDLWKQLSNRPLFGMQSKTFVLYDNKDLTKVDVEALIKQIGDHTLILVYGELDKRSKFYKTVGAYLTTFGPSNIDGLIERVRDRFPDMPDVLSRVIVSSTRGNIAHLEMELHKLENLPKHMPLNILAINSLIPRPIKDNVFDFIDAVSTNNAAQAFQHYDIVRNESPVQLISMLYKRFKHLFIVQYYQQLSDKEIAEQTGLTPFQIRLVRPYVNQFELEKLTRNLQAIQRAEMDTKRGDVDARLCITLLLMDILQ